MFRIFIILAVSIIMIIFIRCHVCTNFKLQCSKSYHRIHCAVLQRNQHMDIENTTSVGSHRCTDGLPYGFLSHHCHPLGVPVSSFQADKHNASRPFSAPPAGQASTHCQKQLILHLSGILINPRIIKGQRADSSFRRGRQLLYIHCKDTGISQLSPVSEICGICCV